jgi:hypothetical protein
MGPITAAGSTDIFIVKYYNSAPLKVFSQTQIGGTGDKMLTTFAVDGSGNQFVGGQFGGTFMFAGNSYTAPASGTALFGLYYGPNLRGYSFDSGPGEVHAGMDQAGNVIMAGGFLGTVDLGNGVMVSGSGTVHNIYVAKLNAKFGTPAWLRSFPDPSESAAHGVAVVPFGDSVVVGEVSGTISFLDGGAQMATNVAAFAIRLGQ